MIELNGSVVVVLVGKEEAAEDEGVGVNVEPITDTVEVLLVELAWSVVDEEEGSCVELVGVEVANSDETSPSIDRYAVSVVEDGEEESVVDEVGAGVGLDEEEKSVVDEEEGSVVDEEKESVVDEKEGSVVDKEGVGLGRAVVASEAVAFPIVVKSE
jgi:hypothetical protein